MRVEKKPKLLSIEFMGTSHNSENRVKRGVPEVLYGMEALPGGSRRVIKQSLPVPTVTKGNVY